MFHVFSVILQYNVQNLCEKTDHYEANEKKKNEESFKLFPKRRREMAITIKNLFLEKASPPYIKKKGKKWFNVTKYSRQKIGMRRYF